MTDTIQKIADEIEVIAENVMAMSPATKERRLGGIVNRLRAISARASAGEGGEELSKSERDSRDQQAKGWSAICDVLFELRPEWPYGEGTGIELAVATIRAALTAAPQPAQAGASGGKWVMVERSDLEDFRAWASNVLAAAPQPQTCDCGAKPSTDADQARHSADCGIYPPAHGDGETCGDPVCDCNDPDFANATARGESTGDTPTFLETWMKLATRDRAIISAYFREIATRPTPEAQEARAEPIKAGILCEGRSNLSFHALRPDHSAACSSYLYVRYEGRLAHEIDRKSRCKSKACQKLFDKADADAALALPAQGEGR